MNRYPGTRPFEKTDSSVFYGRENDVEQLCNIVKIEPMVLLFSESGLGKSSLLSAGVFPQLEKNGEYLPVFIRFCGSCEESKGPFALTCDEINHRAADQSIFINMDEKPNLGKFPQDDSLWFRLKKLKIAVEKRPCLVFDQFEEIFVYPREEIDFFAQNLSEAFHANIPQRYRDLLRNRFSGLHETLTQKELSLLYNDPLDLRVIISIRSDKLALLDLMKRHLPAILKRTYQLKPLNNEQARKAIIEPAKSQLIDFSTPTFSYDDEALDKIISFLTKENKRQIESFQLQVICRSIEESIGKQEGVVITKDQLGNLDDIFKSYYSNLLADLKSDEERLIVRQLLEEHLVLPDDQRRRMIHQKQIERMEGMSHALINYLQNERHIIRSVAIGDDIYYELSHDSLIATVLEARNKRIADELDRQRIQRELKENEKKKAIEKRRKTQRILILILICAVTAYIMAGILVMKNRNIAEEKSKLGDAMNRLMKQDEELRNLNHSKEELESEKNEIEKERDGLVEERAKLRNDMSLLELKKNELEDDRNTLEIINESLETNMNNAETRMSELMEKNDSLLNSINQRRRSLQSITDSINVMASVMNNNKLIMMRKPERSIRAIFHLDQVPKPVMEVKKVDSTVIQMEIKQ